MTELLHSRYRNANPPVRGISWVHSSALHWSWFCMLRCDVNCCEREKVFFFSLNLVSAQVWALSLTLGCIHQYHAPVSQTTHKSALPKKRNSQGWVFMRRQFYFVWTYYDVGLRKRAQRSESSICHRGAADLQFKQGPFQVLRTFKTFKFFKASL